LEIRFHKRQVSFLDVKIATHKPFRRFLALLLYFLIFFHYFNCMKIHGRRQRGAGGPCPLWIFIHGTNIVNRGLKMLFFGILLVFGLFSVPPPPPPPGAGNSFFFFFFFFFLSLTPGPRAFQNQCYFQGVYSMYCNTKIYYA